MARCKFSASCLPVLVLLSLSAAAQSAFNPEKGIKLYENYQDSDVEVGGVDEKTDSYGSDGWVTLTVDDSSTRAGGSEAEAQTPRSKYNTKEIELEDIIFNETGGLRADPKAKPGAPGSAENLHDARVAVGEVAGRVLESNHPEREQAPHLLTRETVRDLNAGNKDVARSLDDSLSAALSHSNTTNDAMHFRTGRHKFKSLYGRKGTMYFGPFADATGGRRYITIAP
jgi:hypothetical protein